jgi:c-di-GMP phosphodiesterase
MAEVCVARQPIFGTVGDVVGYELLYRRTSTETSARGTDLNSMSADVIVHAFLNIGLEQLTSGRSAYFNLTREMLLSRAYTLMPPGSVVVELLENVEPDEAVETECEQLVGAGYSLALDDFVWSSSYRRLLELASIVKVDVLDQPPARLDEIAQQLAPYDVQLLAERVETAEVRAMCAGMGYELFQGYYFARPEMVKNQALVSDELAIIQAMTVMRDALASDADAEAAFTSDIGLSYKLLRMVNSAARGGRGIESIRHALQLTGRAELSKWLALVLVSSIAARGAANRELLHLAVQRGRLCELLGTSSGGRDPGALFLVGLFSLLDAISGIPMPKLLESISLAMPLRQALMDRTGPYAGALSLAEAYERGAWKQVTEGASSSGIEPAHVGALYVQSLAWTRERLLSLALG